MNSRQTSSNWINYLTKILRREEKFEWLELNLTDQSNLSIASGGSYKANINKVKGNLRFRLLAPVIIKITPTPTNKDLVIWKDKKFLPSDRTNGIYTFNEALNKSAPTSKERPQ